MSAEQFREAAGSNTQQQPSTGKDLATKLFQSLDARKPAIKALLPKSIDVDAFVGVIKTAILTNQDLLAADQMTLFTACMQAAQRGLLPDGKESVLNIYNTNVAKKGQPDKWVKKVQFLPMWGGMVKKLYESGMVTFVDAVAVYKADHFDYERGDNPKIVHRPTLEDEPGPVIAAYCVIKLKNGEVKREVMPRRDIEKVRAVSKAANGPGWRDWYDQFAIKAVGKRAFKQLPSMPDLEALVDLDNKAMGADEEGATPAVHTPADTAALLGQLTFDPAPTADFTGGDSREPEHVERKEDAKPKAEKKSKPKDAKDVEPGTPAPAPKAEANEVAELRFADYKAALEACDDADRAHELMESARGIGILSEQQLGVLQAMADKVK